MKEQPGCSSQVGASLLARFVGVRAAARLATVPLPLYPPSASLPPETAL